MVGLNGGAVHRAQAPVAAAQANVRGRVKWFNCKKGFGFIEPSDGRPDVLLHITATQAFGPLVIYEGTWVECEVILRGKGLLCTKVLSVDNTYVPSAQPHGGITERAATVLGTARMEVKVYFTGPGYGFFRSPMGDVFIHAQVLRNCGIKAVAPGEIFSVTYGRNELDTHRRLVATNVAPLRR